MMTLEKTVDVTGDRNVHFDITLPEAMPEEAVQIIIRSVSTVAPGGGAVPVQDPSIAAVMREAEEKLQWRRAHPAEFEAQMKALRGCLPPSAFGGLTGAEFQRQERREWEDRLVELGLSDSSID